MSTALLKNSPGVHETSRGPYIGCFSGRKFYPLDVRTSDIHIEDIAHALSNMCRFAGHCKKFYSVAQHSVHVSNQLPEELRLAGLLHDASEAYLVDVPRPIKHIADFSPYRKVEREIMQAVYKKFGITDSPLIHDADNLLLATEARDLMSDPSWAKDMPKGEFKIWPWTPEKAERVFLNHFALYTKGKNA